MGLDDPYYRKPWTPSDTVNQGIGQAQQALGGFERQVMQNDMMKMQQAGMRQDLDFQNSAITPEQEAVMSLQAEDADIPMIAARYRQRLQGGNNATGMSQYPQVGMQGQPRMQVVGGGMSGGAVQMPQPMGGQQQQYNPMTQRQYAATMPGLSPIAQQKRGFNQENYRMKVSEEGDTQRQNMADKSKEKIAQLQGESKEELAMRKTEFEREKMTFKQDFDREKLEFAKKKWAQNLDYLRDKMHIYESEVERRGKSDPELKAMVEMFGTLVRSATNRQKGIDGLVNPKAANQGDEELEKANNLREEIEKRIKAKPSTGSEQTESSKTTSVSGTKQNVQQYKVGDTFTGSDGKKREVVGFNPKTKKPQTKIIE